MTTVAELALEEQIQHLADTANQRGWRFTKFDDNRFTLGMQARDESWYWLRVECDRFLEQPPAFHWFNPETNKLDQRADTPSGGGFFHDDSGRICAPWNRLAYKQVDDRGPHADWALANWRTNEKTRGATTLCAMVLRIYIELQGPQYKGRLA